MTPARPSVLPVPQRHIVKIQSTGTKLAYVDGTTGKSAAAIRVKRGDVVQWHFEHGNFSIVFKGRSPFAEPGYAGTGNVPTRDAEVTGADGKYEYAVTVVPAKGQPILDDPNVIVGDGD